jgi:hypothetical protein
MPFLGFPQYYTGATVDTGKCWRCYQVAVDHHDDLGLCEDCSEALRDPELAKELGFAYGKPDEDHEDRLKGPYRVVHPE